MNAHTRGTAILVLLLATLSAAPSQAARVAIAQNDPAPHVFGRDLEGAYLKHDWSAQRLTLVNFWATWCAPCRRELPMLEEVSDRFAEQGLRVIGVCTDRMPAPELAAWLEPYEIEYTILVDAIKVAQAWGGVAVMPTSFLVDSEGIVLRRYVGGAEAATEALLGDVEAFFDGRPLADPYIPSSTSGQ